MEVELDCGVVVFFCSYSYTIIISFPHQTKVRAEKWQETHT